MRLQSAWNLGDTAYRLHVWRTTKTEKCALCKGKGRVQIVSSDEKVRCPKCDHRGLVTLDSQIVRFSVQKLTIGQIQAVATDATAEGGRVTEIMYMAHETGIRSGSVYYPSDLFATEDEAVAAAIDRGADLNSRREP